MDRGKIDDFTHQIASRSSNDIQQRAIAETAEKNAEDLSADAVKVITKYVPVPTLKPDQLFRSICCRQRGFHA